MGVQTGLNISVEWSGPVRVLRVGGEVDLASAPALRTCLMDPRPSDTIIDLSDVSFMDSSGIKVLVVVHKRAIEDGWKLTVRSPGRAVAKVLALTGADRVLTIEP